MNLRIARKIERRVAALQDAYNLAIRLGRQPTKWWHTYTVDQFWQAMRRLRRKWRSVCPIVGVGPDRRSSLTPDWFASNRLESFAIRQGVLHRKRRERARGTA